MPKGKNKKKTHYNKRERDKDDVASIGHSEDSLEKASIMSIASESSLPEDILESGKTTDEAEPVASQNDLEEMLKESIDSANQKSSVGRLACFQSISKAFKKISSRKDTIADIIERGLKKGKPVEQLAALELMMLFCIQLGDVSEIESLGQAMCPLLSSLLTDNAVSKPVRAKCASALGLFYLLGKGEIHDLRAIMQIFETIFGSFPAKDDTQEMLEAALGSWSLLLTLLPVHLTIPVCKNQLPNLIALLDSSDVDVRITAGEAIALLQELNQELLDDDGLHSKLKELATDSHKYRAKKDRKQQRSTFRDVMRSVVHGENPNLVITFGKEILELNTWCRRWYYNSLCRILHSGMNLHLRVNELLRDIFDLGDPLATDMVCAYKPSKLERHLYNVASCKARTIHRNKHRDKRVALF